MEQNGHVVFVISSIEAGDIDEGTAQAITKILSIECWFPVVGQIHRLPVLGGILHILLFCSEGGMYER